MQTSNIEPLVAYYAAVEDLADEFKELDDVPNEERARITAYCQVLFFDGYPHKDVGDKLLEHWEQAKSELAVAAAEHNYDAWRDR